MQISTRFSIAVHILLCAEILNGQYKLTSEFLAASVGANPVVIRRLSAQLKKAGLLRVPPGTGGAGLGRPAGEISLYDVYKAVEAVEENSLFNLHERPNPACVVGRNIETLLNGRLRAAQLALEDSLKETSIADLAAQVENLR